jgi:hypothetical protein
LYYDFNKDTAEKTAELLLQINAIKLNPGNPFTWASGWKSPIYCDNRLILSFPVIRNYVRDEFSKNIEKQFGKPDVIAGVATGDRNRHACCRVWLTVCICATRAKTRASKPSRRVLYKDKML